MTLAGAKFGNSGIDIANVGYEFKRLPNSVPTGIYECNSRCKCKKSCLNRVAQHPLQIKLQVFKTGNRGWGLRCLNDVSRGSFICVYAGDLLTEANANIAGGHYGDEYFAELDYIEVAENLKEGYEPDAEDEPFDEEDEVQPDEPRRNRLYSDDDEFVAQTTTIRSVNTRYNTRHSVDLRTKSIDSRGTQADDSDEEVERQKQSFLPKSDQPTTKYRSVRKFFGKKEDVYIMDAKKSGNIGRYFNVSIYKFFKLAHIN